MPLPLPTATAAPARPTFLFMQSNLFFHLICLTNFTQLTASICCSSSACLPRAAFVEVTSWPTNTTLVHEPVSMLSEIRMPRWVKGTPVYQEVEWSYYDKLSEIRMPRWVKVVCDRQHEHLCIRKLSKVIMTSWVKLVWWTCGIEASRDVDAEVDPVEVGGQQLSTHQQHLATPSNT